MLNKEGIYLTFGGRISQKAKVLPFPKRPKMPPTISELVAGYSAARVPRGLYFTPLPDDWRRNVQ